MTQAPTWPPKAECVFPLLADPAGYVACRWDLTLEHAKRAYWLAMYREHFPQLLEQARQVLAAQGMDKGRIQEKLSQCRKTFLEFIDALEANPGRWGRLDMVSLTLGRERVLRGCGLDDPYSLAKEKENQASLALLPALLEELDAMEETQRARRLIEGVFAGNIYDLGATSITARLQREQIDFEAVRQQLKPRPWLVDDLDGWIERLNQGPHRSAMLFVDNAGPDVLLGMFPLARELVRRGTRVLLAANSEPALNDITAGELGPLLEVIAREDAQTRQALAQERMIVVATGNAGPLIDLTRVSGELVEAAHRYEVDLVVLEGMGRALESNFDAAFTCDCLKIAMLKIQGLAQWMGGELYDLVMRFERAKRR